MSLKPLRSLGMWRAAEGALEIIIPLLAVGGTWFYAYRTLGAASIGRAVTWVELTVVLGAVAALTGWMSSRQMFQARKRNPWTLVVIALVYTFFTVGSLTVMAPGSFTGACEALEGEVVATQVLAGREAGDILPEGPEVCRLGGVPDNPYLPGTIIRPAWDGKIHPLLLVFLALVASTSALGLRDKRIFRTTMGEKLFGLLRYAPALGAKTGKGKIKNAKVQACSNATLWGETCAQMYPAEKVFEEGEWCVRCHQAYRRARRELRFKIVTLYADEIDVLNGLERVDTVAWDMGSPMPPDARISGEERWVVLGDVTVPDVITVSQLLALVHGMVPKWSAKLNPRGQRAARIASKRASRVSAWIWFGSLAHRLTYARPNHTALMALGTARLKDIVPESGSELWLQLDIGLLPVEVRTGFRKVLSDGRVQVDNNKVDIWIPTSPPKAPKADRGVWIPRVEGGAMRQWLATEQLRDDGHESASLPLPYHRFNKNTDDEGQFDPPAPPRPGTLDLVRLPLEGDGHEPIVEGGVPPGTSISDWDWLEPEQIQLLRQQCVVMVSAES